MGFWDFLEIPGKVIGAVGDFIKPVTKPIGNVFNPIIKAKNEMLHPFETALGDGTEWGFDAISNGFSFIDHNTGGFLGKGCDYLPQCHAVHAGAQAQWTDYHDPNRKVDAGEKGDSAIFQKWSLVSNFSKGALHAVGDDTAGRAAQVLGGTDLRRKVDKAVDATGEMLIPDSVGGIALSFVGGGAAGAAGKLAARGAARGGKLAERITGASVAIPVDIAASEAINEAAEAVAGGNVGSDDPNRGYSIEQATREKTTGDWDAYDPNLDIGVKASEWRGRVHSEWLESQSTYISDEMAAISAGELRIAFLRSEIEKDLTLPADGN